MIRVANLGKSYRLGAVEVPALSDVSLRIAEGEFVAVMGPSGSGKSTLMNILGCLDRPTNGSYFLNDVEVSRMNDNELARIRNRLLGFVFQSFNLLSKSDALANVEMPLIYAGVARRHRHQRALAMLDMVGLGNRVHHRPSELSGGQQQRVAIARALINNPKLLLADEPTGNLDTRSGEEIMSIFQGLNAEGITIIMVTHDADVASHTHRILRFRDGRLVSDEPVQGPALAHGPVVREA